jgi:SAM-dependent methyltransferase
MAGSKKLDYCVCCDTYIGKPYLNLGQQPLANSYHKGEEQEVFPLELCCCSHCTHNQLSVAVAPKKMFEDYLYVSETSKTLRDYFQWFATERILPNISKEAKVLDIAGNTGYLLSLLPDDIFTINVDPAKNLSKISKSRVDKHYATYWNGRTASTIIKNHGKVDVIVAMNVLGHVSKPVDFLLNCISCLNHDGTIYIQTSQADMFFKNEFDTCYHEHISFFTAQSYCELARTIGMNISSFEITPVHGGSFLVGFQIPKDMSVNDACFEPTIPDSMKERIQQEKNLGIGKKEFHELYAEKCIKVKNDFVEAINQAKKDKVKIVGYGAAAKGNTFLNFANCSLDYIVDDNPNKVGFQCPGHNTTIASPEKLFNETEPCLVVVLAWNFLDEISKKINNNSKAQHRFLTYFPELKII